MFSLRDYQQDAVDRIRNEYRAGKKAPLLVLPTGGGKTVVFSYVTASAAARGNRVWILVHRIELLRQTSMKLQEAGVDHGLINPKYTPNYMAPVQVASVQTLTRRMKHLPPPSLIVVDEAHHATAGTWRAILNEYPAAKMLGVTATPIRSDGQGLGVEAGGFFDTMVEGPQIQELIRRGYLVNPVVFAPQNKVDLSGVQITRGDYDQKQLAEMLDKQEITGDAVAHYQKLAHGSPAVAFCVSVAHAEHVAEQFRAAGYRAYAVDGSMEDDVRRRILAGLGNGSVDVVASCDLISEGTDIPAIGAAILLRPTQSTGLYIQQIGRALRPCAGKDRAIILDHVGNTLIHGLPDDARDWSLDGEKRKKGKKDADENALRIQQCPKCYAVHEKAPACTICGHVYEAPKFEPPKVVAGELTEITPEMRANIKRMKAVEVARAKTLEDLQLIEQQRGYKHGWAKHVWASRQKREYGI